MRSAALIGNPRPGSRTARVALRVASGLHDALTGCGPTAKSFSVVDLSTIAARLLDPVGVDGPIDEAMKQVQQARLLIVASPTFKASYTGLLKMFLDRLPPRGLSTVVTVPVMTAASHAHRYAVEEQIRPVLLELGAVLPTPGLSVMESEFAILNEVLEVWFLTAVPLLAAVLLPQPLHDHG